MSGTGVRREALREIAREKARIPGERPLAPYSPEEDRKRENYQPQQEKKKPSPEEETFFEQISPDKINLAERRADDSSFSWMQFSPWRKEGEEKKPKSLNTATIWCLARKMIAREWRRAKGIKKKDFSLDLLEREAAAWKEEKEVQGTRQPEVDVSKHKEKFDEALRIIGERMLEEKDNSTSREALRLIENAMESIGKVYNVEWRNDGFDVCIEPWEERRSGQKRGETLPIIYKLRINDNLQMVSYELVEDEKIRRKQKERMLTNQLEKLIDEKSLKGDEQDIKVSLEKRIGQVGRLIELKKQEENIWIAIIEPWEEVRRRNIERKGQGPVITEAILIKCVNETTIIASPIKKTDKSWEGKELNRAQ
ncbi:hypothetical protein KAV79_03105, partial [Candidatus Aerophobetes bacterium]|nr:hypothetical protein [Candidatus Aerophobetes bacterium]